MFWTITWVTAVTLISIALVLWGVRTTRSNGGVALVAAASFWAFVRWAWMGDYWFLLRPLGGGWVWLIFILLIASLVVAFVLRRDPGFIGWIALFIAVLAPFWDLFTMEMWSWLWPESWGMTATMWTIIAIVFVVGLLMLLFKRFVPGAIVLLVGALVSAIVVGSALLLFPDDSDESPAARQTPTSAASTTAATDGSEEEEFTIRLPKRDGNRLNADGVPKEVRGDGEAFRKFIAEQAKHDPLTLFLYYSASPLGDKAPLKNELILAKDGVVKNGNTYSEEGIAAYNRWAAIWNNPDITSVEAVDEITFQGVNTGVTKGNKPTQDASGVGGEDKSGYDVAYHSATGEVVKGHSALDRCTQPTTDKPNPDIPPGPTDNPPPDNPPPPPPPCVEIEDNGKLDCQPKDPGKEPVQQGNVPPPVNGQNPGTGNQPASPPSANPSPTYTPPSPAPPKPTRDPSTIPSPEPSTPPSSNQEPSPTQDPCAVDPTSDWC